MPLRASIGVAFAPRDGIDVDTLLNHADIALYAVKRAGGDAWRVFDPVLAEADRHHTTREQALRGALARGEFHLVYQPQVSTTTATSSASRPCCAGAIPSSADIAPVEFIGIAEARA
jgi:predicted signal transduction protein with EAL and GGDEF domain